MAIRTRVRSITPSGAAEMLEQGDLNTRPVSNARVNFYADQMRGGKWKLTHQGLAFDDDGNLIDGRHRLLAVVNSGIAIETLCTYGVSDFAHIDVGKNRSVGDILAIDGHKNANILGAALRLIACYESGPRPWTTYRRTLSQADILEMADADKGRIEKYIAAGWAVAQRLTGPRTAYIAALAVCGEWARQHDQVANYEQWTVGLQTGVGLGADDARLALANWVASGSKKHGMTNRTEMITVAVVRAFKAHIEGETMRMMGYKNALTWYVALPE